MAKKENEYIRWARLDDKDKSYSVSLMHFFHYRRNRIGKSWDREEMITWELIRALDILPRKYFMDELLKFIKDKYYFFSKCIDTLLKEENNIQVVPFPSMGLKGNKRNRKGDIEISNNKGCLWIEAKTKKTKEEDFHKQLEDENNAMKNLYKNKAIALVALIPKGQNCKDPYITWGDIGSILSKCQKKLNTSDKELVKGYLKMAKELEGRVERFKKV